MIPTGDKALVQSFQEFFSLVGYAISRWADIEVMLFHLCEYGLKTDGKRTSIVLQRFQSTHQQFTLTDSLLQHSLSGTDLADWKQICKRATDTLLPARNKIVHNQITKSVNIMIPAPGAPVPGVTEYSWAIAADATKPPYKKQSVTIQKADVMQHITDVDELFKKMVALRARLP